MINPVGGVKYVQFFHPTLELAQQVEGGLRVLCVSEHDFPAEAPEARIGKRGNLWKSEILEGSSVAGVGVVPFVVPFVGILLLNLKDCPVCPSSIFHRFVHPWAEDSRSIRGEILINLTALISNAVGKVSNLVCKGCDQMY